MDGERAELQAKLDRLLDQAAAVSVTLSRTDGTINGVPHYSVIEEHATIGASVEPLGPGQANSSSDDQPTTSASLSPLWVDLRHRDQRSQINLD